MNEHVHRCCTGPDATCACGYRFTMPRYMVSVEVYDSETKRMLVSKHIHTDYAAAARAVIEAAADEVEAWWLHLRKVAK